MNQRRFPIAICMLTTFRPCFWWASTEKCGYYIYNVSMTLQCHLGVSKATTWYPSNSLAYIMPVIFCLLNHPQVNYGLRHTIEVGLQAAIVSILDFVRSKPDHFHFFGLLAHLCTTPVGRSVVLNIPYKWCGFSLSLSLPHVRPPALTLLSLILGPGCLQCLMYVIHRPLPSSHLWAVHLSIGYSIAPRDLGK